MKDTVNPGDVDWTGDNPFIYLKTQIDGEWSCLALHFRIALSPHGIGQAILLVEAPYVDFSPGAYRLCLTDNAPMARYLIDGFVRHFALFRPCAALLERLDILDGSVFDRENRGTQAHVERAHCADRGVSVAMHWLGLGRPFMVDVPQSKTQTGRHEMFSVFQPADQAFLEVNSHRLSGTTVERDFFGGRAQSAALAHSETWVRAMSVKVPDAA
jgi:hypothetical protein